MWLLEFYWVRTVCILLPGRDSSVCGFRGLRVLGFTGFGSGPEVLMSSLLALCAVDKEGELRRV